jgi:hypothetical protein
LSVYWLGKTWSGQSKQHHWNMFTLKNRVFCFSISSVKYNILILHDHGDKIVQFKSGKKVFQTMHVVIFIFHFRLCNQQGVPKKLYLMKCALFLYVHQKRFNYVLHFCSYMKQHWNIRKIISRSYLKSSLASAILQFLPPRICQIY